MEQFSPALVLGEALSQYWDDSIVQQEEQHHIKYAYF